MSAQQPTVQRLDAPEDHDYPAAASYLSLLADQALVEELVGRLRAAQPASFKVKDILRSAGLAFAPDRLGR